MGEALFQLSVLLQTEASNDAALLLARMALYARGDDPIYLALLADILDAESRTADALAAYRQVPPDAPYGWQAEVKVGEELHRLGRDDEAVAYLKKLVESRPDRSEAAIELGDTLRATKQFADAVKAYDTAIARMGPTRPEDWAVYYFRGIALERSGQWTLAEKDFKKALQLQPDHPYVLNYLGYTWVDRGEHLKEAIKMLQKAVEQKPDDGFIVDSLAWAYYRLGQYDKAVVYQEKAVSLEPGDSVLNDHLGDIYWKLGRHNEARFQWQRALAFKPDADRVAPIEAKLQNGLRSEGERGLSAAAKPSASPSLSLRARAKINLYLHVVGRRPDGYHLLDSLVCFTELGDELHLSPAETLSLEIDGPFAPALGSTDNLTVKAARLLDAQRGAALHLVKNLPVAAGIGGGSADAAAALVGLSRLWNLPAPTPAASVALGADLPVCLADGPRFVGGIGEELVPAPALPRAYLLLVNPRRPLPTIDVFRRYRRVLLCPGPLRSRRRPMRGRWRRFWPNAAMI